MLETTGRLCKDVAQRSRYNCTFISDETLVAALEELRSMERRRECQKHGLSIAVDFSPQPIIQEYVKAFGIFGTNASGIEDRSSRPSQYLVDHYLT